MLPEILPPQIGRNPGKRHAEPFDPRYRECWFGNRGFWHMSPAPARQVPGRNAPDRRCLGQQQEFLPKSRTMRRECA
jgi:hypothetical protein